MLHLLGKFGIYDGRGVQTFAAIHRLYRAWADGGAGLIITGNVMIDGRALNGPGGVVLEADTPLQPFTQWADAAKHKGAQVWMKLNHPGRQVMAAMGGTAWAPSAVALDMGKHSKLFVQPKAMSDGEIQETIARFAASAAAAERAGFTGVEIHAAHGYLISQFGWKDQVMAALARMALVKRRLRLLGASRTVASNYSPLVSLIIDRLARLPWQYYAIVR